MGDETTFMHIPSPPDSSEEKLPAATGREVNELSGEASAVTPPPTLIPADLIHPKARLSGLDGLRALAVALVIFSHINEMPSVKWQWAKDFIPGGGVGVDIFFVLSGFLITWLLLSEERKKGGVNLGRFYFRRAFRIFPPALWYLLCVWLLAHVTRWFVVNGADVLKSALFLRNYTGGSGLTGHYWSLAIEEQFYLLWPLFIVCIRGRSRLLITTALVLAYPFWEITITHLIGYGLRRFDLYYGPLLTGCLLALLRAHPRGLDVLRSKMFSSPQSLAACVVGVLLLINSHIHFSATFGRFAVILLTAAVVNCLVDGSGGIIGELMDWRPLVWMGQLSYSLYLWQNLFCWDYSASHRWIQTMPQSLVLLLLCATFSLYVIERPALQLRDRLQ